MDGGDGDGDDDDDDADGDDGHDEELVQQLSCYPERALIRYVKNSQF